MRAFRGTAVLSAVTAAALLLAGCSGGDDPAPAADASEQESPLSEILSAVYGGDVSPEESERQFAEQQRETEELTAECMQEEGFEYLPNDYSGGFSSGDGTEWQPDDREWVSQYGYGAVTSPYSEDPGMTEEYVDPNADYVASLSESEQQAWSEALYGPPMTEEQMAESEDGSYEYDWRTSGCSGYAQHEVAGEDLSQTDEFRPLFDAINEMYEGMASSPGMAELDAEWATCMDTAGHGGFSTQADAQNSVYEDMNAFYETSSGDGTEAAPLEPDQAALDALAEEEVALALADLECRAETDYRDRYADISRQVEEDFIADHETELDALVAAAEQD